MIGFIKKFRIKILILFFRILPIKKNKIIFWSNSFKDYGCNPKYIAEYLINNFKSENLDIVWVFENGHNIPEKIPSEFRIVKYFSKEYLYELLTARIIITNHRMAKHYYFKKRKKQIYIQTWHSSTRLKKIEKDAISNLSNYYINSAISDSKKCDYIISGSKFSTEIYKNSFWYKGKVLELGTPRMDIMFVNNEKIKNKIKERYNIPLNKRMIIYAPTFRKDKCLDVYNIDSEKIVEALHEKYGGEWVILFRLHPNISNLSNKLKLKSFCYDVSKYEDIQELLSASEILITDYSSCMFDFILVKKMVILYVPDLLEYTKNERGLYFDIEKLPVSISKDNKSLISEIIKFNNKIYVEKCEEFINRIGSIEDGGATKRICEFIINKCN